MPMAEIPLCVWRTRGQSFTFRGQSIRYWTAGQGEPLLLLHGFPTASWDWHYLWTPLAQRFRLIACDMLGFGYSAKPRGHAYSLLEQADLQQALLAHLAISAPVHVLALETERLGLERPRLDLVLAQGASVGQRDRDAVRRVFRAPIMETYSSKEGGQMAQPCDRGRLHSMRFAGGVGGGFNLAIELGHIDVEALCDRLAERGADPLIHLAGESVVQARVAGQGRAERRDPARALAFGLSGHHRRRDLRRNLFADRGRCGLCALCGDP